MEEYSFRYIDYLPYLLLVFFMLFGVYKNGKKNRGAKLCAFIAFIFSAVRYGVAYDYFSYQQIALRKIPGYILDNIEPLPRLITLISCNTHYQFFFVITSAIILYALYRGCILLSLKPEISIYLYVLFPMLFFENLCAVRNGMAYALVFWSFGLFVNGMKKKAIAIFISGVLCHYSVIIGVFIFIVYKFPFSKNCLLILYLLSFFISYFIFDFINSIGDENYLVFKLKEYMNRPDEAGRKMFYLINLFGVFCLMFWDNYRKKFCALKKRKYFFSTSLKKYLDQDMSVVYLNLVCLGVCIFNIFINLNSTLAWRFSTFFLIFIIVLLPSFYLIVSRGLRKYITVVMLSVFFIFYCLSLYVNAKGVVPGVQNAMFPYQTIFHYTKYKDYFYK